MKKIIILLLTFFSISHGFAQENNKKNIEVKLSGKLVEVEGFTKCKDFYAYYETIDPEKVPCWDSKVDGYSCKISKTGNVPLNAGNCDNFTCDWCTTCEQFRAKMKNQGYMVLNCKESNGVISGDVIKLEKKEFLLKKNDVDKRKVIIKN